MYYEAQPVQTKPTDNTDHRTPTAPFLLRLPPLSLGREQRLWLSRPAETLINPASPADPRRFAVGLG
jgi:hypothetical protein